MRKLILGFVTVLALGFSGFSAMAAGHGGNDWMLDADASTVAFGSVKKDVVGESHNFANLAGSVSNDGMVSVDIDLTSVETWIDVRNERIMKHVFMDAATATFSASIDMAALENLGVGEMTATTVNGSLSLGSVALPIEAEVIVVRLSETRVMIVTAEMIWVSTADAGIDEGVSMLQELAKLPGITRAFPVTLRLVFNHNM